MPARPLRPPRRAGGDRKGAAVVYMAPIPPSQSHRLHLLTVTADGRRVYWAAASSRYGSDREWEGCGVGRGRERAGCGAGPRGAPPAWCPHGVCRSAAAEGGQPPRLLHPLRIPHMLPLPSLPALSCSRGPAPRPPACRGGPPGQAIRGSGRRRGAHRRRRPRARPRARGAEWGPPAVGGRPACWPHSQMAPRWQLLVGCCGDPTRSATPSSFLLAPPRRRWWPHTTQTACCCWRRRRRGRAAPASSCSAGAALGGGGGDVGAGVRGPALLNSRPRGPSPPTTSLRKANTAARRQDA